MKPLLNLLIVLFGLASAPAAATVYTLTIDGRLLGAESFDYAGLFGSPGSLEGAAYTAMLRFDDQSLGSERPDLSAIDAGALTVFDPVTTSISLTVNGITQSFIAPEFASLFIQDQPVREQVIARATARLPQADGDTFATFEFAYDSVIFDLLAGYNLDQPFDISIGGISSFAGSFEFGKDIPDTGTYDTLAFGAFDVAGSRIRLTNDALVKPVGEPAPIALVMMASVTILLRRRSMTAAQQV